jgi:ornithine carbamoyltransferase
MYELGGHPLYLGPEEIGLGKRESFPDVARVLSRMVHGIVARVFRQADLETLAAHASVPVINALSDFDHPCQVLANLQTLLERFERLAGLRVGYVGDGNNMANGLVFAAAKVGLHAVLASPPGFACPAEIVEPARLEAERLGGSITLVTDPEEAVIGADVLYTDVWTSMGQEAEAARRREIFQNYRLDRALVERAPAHAIVMHDLPAHRGEEITDEVVDGPRSVVFDQAENRLHAQKAVLLWLMERQEDVSP